MGLWALGIGVGFGVAAYMNLPPLEQGATVAATVTVFTLGLGAAWVGGRRHGQRQSQSQQQTQDQAQDQAQQQGQQQMTIINVLPASDTASPAATAAGTASDAFQEAMGGATAHALASQSRTELPAGSRDEFEGVVSPAPSGQERRQALRSRPTSAAPVSGQARSPAQQDRSGATRSGEA